MSCSLIRPEGKADLRQERKKTQRLKDSEANKIGHFGYVFKLFFQRKVSYIGA